MFNYIEKFFRRLSWEYRTLCSKVQTFGFKHAGFGIHFGYDCVIVGAKYISIGNNFVAHDRNRIEAISRNGAVEYNPTIDIGSNVIISYNCHIGAIDYVKIGNNVLLASNVYISDHDHGNTTYADLVLPPVTRKVISKGPVIIEDNVWIGEGVVILAGVTVGHNSVVAANAVVTKSVPPFSVVAGVPAKVIKNSHKNMN